jgi:hypothetical protein
MDFIQFTEKFKTEDNSALIESIQNGYRIILEAEEKLYTDNDGNIRAKIMINNIDDIDWLAFFEECVAESRKLKNDEDYSIDFINIISNYIEPSIYGGSADWGGDTVYHFDKEVDSPGYEGRYIAENDTAWVVGHRKYDENDELNYEMEVLASVDRDEDPLFIFDTIYRGIFNAYDREVPFSFDEAEVALEELPVTDTSKLNDIYSEHGHFLATENADLSDKEKLSIIKEKMLYQIDDEEENITHKYDLITEMEKQAEQNNVPSYVIEDEIRALNNSASMSKNVIGSYERVIKEIDEILGTL